MTCCHVSRESGTRASDMDHYGRLRISVVGFISRGNFDEDRNELVNFKTKVNFEKFSHQKWGLKVLNQCQGQPNRTEGRIWRATSPAGPPTRGTSGRISGNPAHQQFGAGQTFGKTLPTRGKRIKVERRWAPLFPVFQGKDTFFVFWTQKVILKS